MDYVNGMHAYLNVGTRNTTFIRNRRRNLDWYRVCVPNNNLFTSNQNLEWNVLREVMEMKFSTITVTCCAFRLRYILPKIIYLIFSAKSITLQCKVLVFFFISRILCQPSSIHSTGWQPIPFIHLHTYSAKHIFRKWSVLPPARFLTTIFQHFSPYNACYMSEPLNATLLNLNTSKWMSACAFACLVLFRVARNIDNNIAIKRRRIHSFSS